MQKEGALATAMDHGPHYEFPFRWEGGKVGRCERRVSCPLLLPWGRGSRRASPMSEGKYKSHRFAHFIYSAPPDNEAVSATGTTR